MAAEESPSSMVAELADIRAANPVEVAAMLAPSGNVRLFGAFHDNGALVGTAGVQRDPRAKVRHKAIVRAVYTHPAHRGRGIARALVQAVIDVAHGMQDVRQLTLVTGAHNAHALALYRSLGFTVWGIEPRSMRVGGEWLDDAYMVLMLDR